MNPAHRTIDPIEEIAARWLQIKAERNLADQEAEELALWLAQSERHARAFERLSRAWSSPAVWTALAALAEEERRPKSRHRVGIAAWTGMGLAAALVGFVVLTRMQPTVPPEIAYETGTAQVRSVDLADGSTLHLNGETQVRVRFDRNSRRIDLIRGELSIDVAHEHRPLQVFADDATFAAIGTAFNLDRRADQVVLVVTEGVVETTRGASSPVRVSAGNAARVTAAGVVVAPIDPLAAAWREGALATAGVSIRDLAHALSRYTDKDILVAPAIADEVVSGRFSLTQPDRTLRLLAAAYDLELSEEPKRFVLGPAGP